MAKTPKIDNPAGNASSATTIATSTSTSADTTDLKFENLRQKIEGNLKKSEDKKSQKANKATKAGVAGKENGATTAETPRGKKRTSNGDFKNARNQPRSDNSKRPVQNGSKDESELDLKAIISELGGTEEDLDLINGAQSDSDIEGEDAPTKQQSEIKKGKTLESGMANILKEIALYHNTYKDSGSEDESEVDGEPVATSKSKVNGDNLSARAKADENEGDSIKFKSAATAIEQAKRETSEKGKRSKLYCQPRPDWFLIELPELAANGNEAENIIVKVVERLQDHARSLLQAENEAFKSTQATSSSQSFYNSVIASGTLSDKVSALTLAVQESPLHNMKAFEQLLGLAQKRSRSQAVDVLRAMKDLFAQGSMLPSNRKLHTFSAQPDLIHALGNGKTWQPGEILPAGMTEAHLILWAYEDWLKERYFEVLKVLETWCNDEIEFAKSRATSYVYELLKEKPEQESNLLRLLINKLGDPVKKIASQASYLIMQLLATHPAMKDIVISAIDTDFIFKPGQTMHARYYAAVTLNQTALSSHEEPVAVKLLDIYFALFKILLKPGEDHQRPAKVLSKHKRQREQAEAEAGTNQENELHEKLISAILTGVNRAYPYAGADHKSFDEHIDTLFQITHSANFNTSIQAMMLIQQLIAATSAPQDRFYRVLYESLLDPRLLTSSKQQLYLNLLHRSLKADLSQKRVKAFAKRILQILSIHEPSFVCGAFFLLKDLEKTFPSLATMIDQPEEHEDDIEENFRDVDPSRVAATQAPTSATSTAYDATKRDPAYANADNSCLWDVLPYLGHFHPSVSVSADHIISHQPLPGKPDLSLHTLIHFLDRFIYKNAKLSAGDKMRGSSIMQPMANEDSRAVLSSSAGRTRQLPVNSAEFLAKKASDVPAEDVFFHQYFKTLGKAGKKEKTKKKKDVEEDENASDNEDEVWQAMLNNAPDLEGLAGDEEDEFSDMDGFEEAMASDENDSEEMGVDGTAAKDDDDDSDIDIEAGIFDDSDEEPGEDGDAADLDDEDSGDAAMLDVDDDEFGGLSDDNEAAKKAPSKKTMQRKEDRERKKKLKALPTFASAADWAKQLDDDEDEDLG